MFIGYENALNKEVRSTMYFMGFEKPMISIYENLSYCHIFHRC